VILDEAMVIPEAFLGALMPTLSARPEPAALVHRLGRRPGDMEHGVVFARVRERAIAGKDPSLAYFGWSPPFEHPDDVPGGAASDPDVWAQANPALGIRIALSTSRRSSGRWTRGRSRSSARRRRLAEDEGRGLDHQREAVAELEGPGFGAAGPGRVRL
jgi:hypothetical protein